MDKIERRAAVAAYKERKAPAGVFALRCAATGEVWVGQAPDLDKIWNRLSFTLRSGGHPRRALQATWSAHGEAGFAFEVLERLGEELEGYALRSEIEDKVALWREKLGAAPI
jgi:hypothetical protein